MSATQSTKAKQQSSARWTIKTVDPDVALRAEILEAQRNPLRPNLRCEMQSLQMLPMQTSCMSYNGSLAEWLDACIKLLQNSSSEAVVDMDQPHDPQPSQADPVRPTSQAFVCASTR